jgi:hypothetical protein
LLLLNSRLASVKFVDPASNPRYIPPPLPTDDVFAEHVENVQFVTFNFLFTPHLIPTAPPDWLAVAVHVVTLTFCSVNVCVEVVLVEEKTEGLFPSPCIPVIVE